MKGRHTHYAMLPLAAIACLTVGLQACNRDTPDKFIAAGSAYLAKRDFSAAAIQFKNAVQKAPNHAQARYLLGITLEQLDELGSAEIELRKAVSAGYAPKLLNKAHTLAPDPAGIQLNLAKALIKAGQSEAARQQLELLARFPADNPTREEAQKLLSAL
jgi:Flp pilus assembly protein TadD